MNEQKRRPVGILLTVILIAALLTVCLELGLGYLRPDIPGSIPKHLIHFGIMFALLGGAVLLCLFCPPFKKLWAWIDEHILSQETRPIAIDIIYAVFIGLMLLHHFYVILYYPTIPTGATKFAPIWLILAAVTVLLGKSWRNISFRLAAIFFLFSFERLYLEKLAVTGETAVYFFSAIYALFICLGAFSVFRPSVRKPFLQTLCVLWTLATLALSIAGLYTAWTGIQIPNFVGTTIHVEKGRLWVFAYPTITATFCGCGSIMTLIGFSASKHKSLKIFFILSCLISLIANSLTDARASFIVLAFMISGTICISLWSIYRNNKFSHCSRKKTSLIIIALIFCFGLCFYGAVEGQRLLGACFIEARNNETIIIPTAKAEEPVTETQPEPIETISPPMFDQRDVWFSDETNIDYTLNGRIGLWRRASEYVHKYPLTLLFGKSVDGTVNISIVKDNHSHNLLLQTLLEGGFPSLLLFFSLILFGIFHSFKLWNRRGVPFWQHMLPIPMFAILLWEIVECVSHFSFGHPPMTLLWFFLGATITVTKSLEKTPKANEVPASIPATETGE